MAIKLKKSDQSVAIDMTPMIDIVFQLLAFFIFTLKITTQEGDFNITMPLAAPRAGQPDPNQVPPIKVRIRATADGSCNGIFLNPNDDGTGGTPFGNNGWKQLRAHIASLVGTGSQAASAEVTIDADYNLDYENVIKCITAVSGERDPNTGNITKMVEKIKFAPPRPPGG
ncbi:MAG: biopolymer transporter ExbD [Planctomycetales bacterium]|nr:biopolymer transporter ExbD [Planctomycetales bacterium]